MIYVIKEFKEFALRGNVLDLAIGVVIGAAFGSIVSSLVDDIIMPLVSLFTGGVSFTDYFISLDGRNYSTLAAAQEAGAATINYGQFLGMVLNFIIIAFSIFLVIKWINKFKRKEEDIKEEVIIKDCVFCKTEIPIEASRCPNCTSELKWD